MIKMAGKEIPISQVPPTYSSSKLVKFTNIDDERFVHPMGGKKYSFKAGKSVMLSESVAVHFAKNLANKLLFRDDDSLLKYAGIDEKLNRERTNRGETPIIKGVSQEAVDTLVKKILNNHIVSGPADEEITDIEEIGVAVSEESKKEEKKSPGRPKKEVEENKEFADLLED